MLDNKAKVRLFHNNYIIKREVYENLTYYYKHSKSGGSWDTDRVKATQFYTAKEASDIAIKLNKEIHG